MTKRAFTANRLGDGAVVFLDGHFGWTERFSDARLFSTDAELGDLSLIAARAEDAGQVVGPYPIEVDFDQELGFAIPARLRERIRAFGPTKPDDSAGPAREGVRHVSL